MNWDNGSFERAGAGATAAGFGFGSGIGSLGCAYAGMIEATEASAKASAIKAAELMFGPGGFGLARPRSGSRMAMRPPMPMPIMVTYFTKPAPSPDGMR